MNHRIYLDCNATTPLAAEAVHAMSPWLVEAYGNPSSLHWAGLPARDAVERARSQVAALLCCDATEIVFTSGGTEANNLAIKGLYFARRRRDAPFHVITSRIEHPAVLEPCAFLATLGAEVTRLPVDRYGMVDPGDVRRALRPHTALVSIMHANNEVGTIQPISEIASIAREHGVPCHTDAAQTVGKISADVESLGVDLLSLAGHKLYGPKGVGALFVREGVELEPLLHGAGHEAGRRAGTENVLEIVGLGAACELAQRWIEDPAIAALRDEFWAALQQRFAGRVALNGHPEQRLPNTLNVGFRGTLGSELLAAMPDVAASTGSACHAGALHASPVLTAMGVPEEIAHAAVRFSLGRDTTRAEIDAVVELLAAEVLTSCAARTPSNSPPGDDTRRR
jgi:cysteine desulfurase